MSFFYTGDTKIEFIDFLIDTVNTTHWLFQGNCNINISITKINRSACSLIKLYIDNYLKEI